jgi:hypothetical protein
VTSSAASAASGQGPVVHEQGRPPQDPPYVYKGCDWIDLDAIEGEAAEIWWRTELRLSGSSATTLWPAVAPRSTSRTWDALEESAGRCPDGATIVIGVDGARHDDALAIVACEVETGYMWPLDIIERPDDADENYEHDKDRADGAVSDAFERYAVWRCYCDEHHIRHLIEGWQNRYGEKRVATWLTNRNQPIAWAVRNFRRRWPPATSSIRVTRR